MKQKITLAAVAMAVSLTGIIILQLYWINGAVTVRSKQFDGQVFDAINDVSDKLQIHEGMMILPKILPGMDSIQRKTVDSFYTKRMGERHHRGKFAFRRPRQRNGSADDNPFRPIEPEKEHHPIKPLDSTDKTGDIVSQGDFRDSMLADSGRRLMARTNIYGRLLRKMIVNYISENKEITKRLTGQLMDSLLQNEFKRRGIDIPYQAALLHGDTRELSFVHPGADTAALRATQYRTKLFRDDMVPQHYFMVVYFTNKKAFVIHSIGLILPGSFAFLIIIIASCGFTIYMLLKQKKLSEIKNDFINNMTHEFKTPIATISLATDAINDPRIIDNKEKLKHYTSIIKEENNRMNLQVQKVLNTALMDKQDLKLNLEEVDVHEVIEHIVSRFSLQINERKGSLVWHGDAQNHIILGDEMHLGNVINNLLDNANKYSPDAPKINIFTYNKDNFLYIGVEDKGIGMTKEVQKKGLR